MASAASATLPALVVGAGLDQPGQAAAAAAAGYGAVRMTMLWPDGAAAPDPGAIAALSRLPAGTNLVLGLYVTSPPADDTGRAALASYAASVAAQVPAVHDLVLGPGPSTSTAAGYEAALAAVYDAVKTAAPLVRVDADLDGAVTPKASLTALSSAYLASGRAGPLMDELAFVPAPTAGKNLWPVASVPALLSALESTFPGLPVIVDGLSADTLPIALKTVACSASVVGVILGRVADSSDALTPGVAAAQGPDRGCAAPVTTPPPTTTPAPHHPRLRLYPPPLRALRRRRRPLPRKR